MTCRHICCVKQTVSARDAHFRWSLAWQAGLVPPERIQRTYAELTVGATSEGLNRDEAITAGTHGDLHRMHVRGIARRSSTFASRR